MLTSEKIKALLEYANQPEQQVRLRDNARLLNIYDNSVTAEVESALRQELEGKAFQAAVTRISPINVCRRIVDKLSTLYSKDILRQSAEDSPVTKAAIQTLESRTNYEEALAAADNLLNLHKYVLIQPYSKGMELKFRAISADKFLVWSDDIEDPNNPTAVILTAGISDSGSKIYKLYDEDESIMVSEDGTILTNPQPNPVAGQLPFVYVNKSKYSLMPKADDELLKISVLIPVLLTDVNFATKFQAFGILYGIDVDLESAVIGPNYMWSLKSDDKSNSKPEVGTLTPDASVDKMLKSAAAQLSLYLETRGLRPGTAGTAGLERAESGIAMIIQNSDTSEDLAKRQKLFKKAESDLSDLIDTSNDLWNIPQIAKAPGDRLKTAFPEAKAILTDSEKINNIINKKDNGLITHLAAIREANVGLSEAAILEIFNSVDRIIP
jgi:hypothetical protein